METARLIRVGFLQQNAYHAVDTYVPLPKQLKMMQTILRLYDGVKEAVDRAMVIGPILLLEKSGGKSGDFIRPKEGE